MGSNQTQRRAQATILASQVEALRDWALVVDCGPCGPRMVAMATLPADATIQRVLLRMRCRVCRGKVATAALDNARTGDPKRRVVRVWGPGSSV